MDIADLMPSIKKLIAYDYKDIKSPLYENIITEILVGVHPTPKPQLIQVGGIPGAGKSTFCRQMQFPGAIYLSFDVTASECSHGRAPRVHRRTPG